MAMSLIVSDLSDIFWLSNPAIDGGGPHEITLNFNKKPFHGPYTGSTVIKIELFDDTASPLDLSLVSFTNTNVTLSVMGNSSNEVLAAYPRQVRVFYTP